MNITDFEEHQSDVVTYWKERLMPIYLFMAAGAMLLGGGYLFDEAKREAARQEALAAKRYERELLGLELDLEDTRELARSRGLNPDDVIAGAAQLGTGSLAIDDVIAYLDRIPETKR